MQKGVDFPGINVTFYCYDGEGNVLLQKRSKNCRDEHERWDCGGGSVDQGETILETLEKEIKEEYGAEILDYEFLGNREVFREHLGKKTHWVTFDYKVLVNKEKVGNGEPHKFEEVKWFKKDELPEPLHSCLIPFIEKYKEKL